jgi:transposase
MNPPLYVRDLSQQERHQLESDLRTAEAFRLRRAQIILASAQGYKPQIVAQTYGTCSQTVRNVIRAFNENGLDALQRQSTRPKSAQPLLDAAALERLEQILHQSPRTFGKNTSLWSQALLAEVVCEQGLTEHIVSQETIRRALSRLGANWKRAKHWITSPDPLYSVKKNGASD